MLHTIIPYEAVMDGFDNMECDYEEITVNGLHMQVEMLDGKRAKIIRLYSGNANDYLLPQYSPGSIINMRAVPDGT
jgi:hypothetical protein